MFRLANFDDRDTEEGSLYRYLSMTISQTIIDSLDEYLDNSEMYNLFFQYAFADGFFKDLSQYVIPRAFCPEGSEADAQAGYEFTFSKMRRMREKMLDKTEFYTFDLFEERILYFMCSIDADRSRTAVGKNKREQLKDKVEAARIELREKYKLKARDANDYSRKMYYASAMLLKDSEDENIIFWDDDYDFFWKDGFIEGIRNLKSIVGQNAGYGYKYTCEIFSDIGIKPPLLLLGSKEANRIVNEEQNKRFMEHMDEFFESIQRESENDDLEQDL